MSKTGRHRDRRYGKRQKPARQARRRGRWDKCSCLNCGAGCRIGEEVAENGRLIGTILEREPDEKGLLVRRADGYLERDEEFAVPGTRYSWHHCPVINGLALTALTSDPGSS